MIMLKNNSNKFNSSIFTSIRTIPFLTASPKLTSFLDRAKELGMDALALTDHGVLYGAIEFYQKAERKRNQADHRLRNVSGSERPRKQAPEN